LNSQRQALSGEIPQESIAEMLADRKFAIIFALLILVRLGVFLATIWFPLPNELGLPVSPIHYQTGTDFHLYEDARRALFESDLVHVVDGLKEWMFNSAPDRPRVVFGVTRLTLLVILQITGYAPGNTLPLASLYLLMSIVWLLVWMAWLRRKSVNWFWIGVFGLLPVPIWFTLNISTDFLLAAFVAGFFLAFEKGRLGWAAAFLLLGILTRPNGISLALFWAVYYTLFGGHLANQTRLAIIMLSAVVGLAVLPFLWNNLYNFAVGSSQTKLLVYSQFEFLSGIYSSLPGWLNIPLSWLSLLGVKILFAVGLRPSFSDTAIFLVLIRSASGLILLPGLIRAFVSGPNWLRLFLVCFLLPIFLGLAQERYLLPIVPILFFYGALTLQDLWHLMRNRLLQLMQTAPGR